MMDINVEPVESPTGHPPNLQVKTVIPSVVPGQYILISHLYSHGPSPRTNAYYLGHVKHLYDSNDVSNK